jgi:cathepsin A (carboxypeptidase C)
MKVATSALLLGAASAAFTPPQQVLKDTLANLDTESWSKPLHDFEESLKGLTGEARRIWDEVAMMFPESFDKSAFFSSPKPHTRRPSHEWDHIVKGADVQSVWVENAQGEKEREIDGKLENYNLRVKKVDPSSLGVDKVKQYSGYLDDEETDKHLFYCRSIATFDLIALTSA